MNKLAAGFLFLLMPFNSQNSSVICFHIVKEGPSGRTEGVASPTFLPLPKGSGIRRYLWDPAPLASPLCRTISALSVKTFWHLGQCRLYVLHSIVTLKFPSCFACSGGEQRVCHDQHDIHTKPDPGPMSRGRYRVCFNPTWCGQECGEGWFWSFV